MSLYTPTWRYLRLREKHTLEELRLLFDWSLPGDRIYGLSPEDRFSIVAKVEVNTEEPIYPCRPSECREVRGEVEYHVKQEFVNAATLRLARAREREAWRKYEEFRAAFKNGEPKRLGKCLSREERGSVERIWKRIARRAGAARAAKANTIGKGFLSGSGEKIHATIKTNSPIRLGISPHGSGLMRSGTRLRAGAWLNVTNS